MNKRGQAAMEFLMTYGWAILVVLVVIGALAYFGILNPSTLLPERCEFQIGLNCKDHRVNQSEIRFSIENGKGNDINIVSITARSLSAQTNCSWDWATAGEPSARTIYNGDVETFALNAYNGVEPCNIPASLAGRNVKAKWLVEIVYYNVGSDPSFTHTAEGQLLAKVE